MAHEVLPDQDDSRDPNQAASKFPQFIAAIFATLIAAAAGAALAWTSGALPLLAGAGRPLTEAQGALGGALITAGAAVGALPAGQLARRLGRKALLLGSAGPLLVSWVLLSASVASGPWCLYLGRLLAGLSVGAVSVAAPTYISEIAEPSVRGTLGTFFQLQLTVGVLFGYVVGLVRSVAFASLASASLPVLFLATFAWMPESPGHLLATGRKGEAVAALRWLRGSRYDVEPELRQLRSQMVAANGNRSSAMDLVRDPAAARALLISLGLMVFQQLSAVNAIVFYSQQIFQSVGNSIDPTVASIVFGVVQVLATYSSTVLIECAGRRCLLLISSSSMSVCLFLLGTFFFFLDFRLPDVIPLVILAIFISSFSLGFGPVPWVVTGEIFPDNLKGVASSLAATFSWSLAFGVTFFFNILKDLVGYSFTFWSFAVCCVVGTVFVAFLLPETRGKDIETIREELGGEKRLLRDDYTTDTLPPAVVVALKNH